MAQNASRGGTFVPSSQGQKNENCRVQFVFSAYSDEYALNTNSKCVLESTFCPVIFVLLTQEANQFMLRF